MRIRTPGDLGAVIRHRRKQRKLGQAGLAKLIGVSRPWVVEIEHGHPRAELALVLRALDALDIRLDIITGDARASDKNHHASTVVDIDAIVAKAKTRTP